MRAEGGGSDAFVITDGGGSDAFVITDGGGCYILLTDGVVTSFR